MSLPGFADYNERQLQTARDQCPAIDRYFKLLDKDAISFEDHIRQFRHERWLLCALAVFHNTKSPKEICSFWSQSADEIIRLAWKHFELEQENLSLFALGKLGAEELNLSSDVDLLVVGTPKDQSGVVNRIRRFKRCLEAQTEFAFALRVDFDLRPDGAWGPLLISVPMFQDHYWSRGETWERLAFVRLRHITGSPKLRTEIEDLASRFCYRKYVDYTLQEDLKQLRSQIHNFRPEVKGDSFNLKLGIGGIRDIELYVHSLQIMHGGRVNEVRQTSTSLAIKSLSHHFPQKSVDLVWLEDAYWQLRDIENKVQISNDQQTHTLTTQENYPFFSSKQFETALQLANEVNKRVSKLLGEINLSETQLPSNHNSQEIWLRELGFGEPTIQNVWPEIIKATALSHKRDRDEVIRRELLFRFVSAISTRPKKRDLALAYFLDFLRSTRAKATLFALLVREEKLLRMLANLFCTSNYMARVLTSRPELLDGFIYGHQELASGVEDSLEILLDRRLISEIRTALLFQDRNDPEQVSLHLSSTADQICLDLKQIVKQEIPGSDFLIFAMGKWGSYELGFHSDLDFILIKNGEIRAEDHRAAKRFISFLTSPQKGGKIYNVDLRLRPSGTSGPLLVTLKGFYEYIETKAQAWERQSYLKLRPLDHSLIFNFDRISTIGLSDEDLVELKRIRSKLLKPVSAESMDIKYCPGGLIDIELCTQTSILSSKLTTRGSTLDLSLALESVSNSWTKHGPELREHYIKLRSIEQAFRLASQSSELLLKPDKPLFEDTARLLNSNPEDLWEEASRTLQASAALVKELDPIFRHD